MSKPNFQKEIELIKLLCALLTVAFFPIGIWYIWCSHEWDSIVLKILVTIVVIQVFLTMIRTSMVNDMKKDTNK